MPPLAIFGILVSGLWLTTMDDSRAVVSHSTVRGLHLLFGLVMFGDGVYLVTSTVRRVVAGDWKAWLDRAMLVNPRNMLEWGYWALLALMMLSGLARLMMERYEVTLVEITPAFGWGVAHVLVSKYFMAVMLVRLFVFGTARGSWLLAYLRKP